MRAVVKNRIGIFYPQGFIDGGNARNFLAPADITATSNLKVDMLLVSLKKVVFFNKNGMDILVSLLGECKKNDSSISLGFCDYDDSKFVTMMKFFTDDYSISLFRTAEVAALFGPSTSDNQEKNILVHSDDPSQRNAITIELHEHGYNPIATQTREEFSSKRQSEETFYEVVNNTHLGLFGKKIGTRVVGNAIIYSLDGFLDAKMNDIFDMTYHKNSLSVGFTLFVFDMHKVIAMNVHGVNFFSHLASAGAEFGASIAIIGLSFEKTPKAFQEELEDGGVLFFSKLEDLLNNKEIMEELGGDEGSIKQSKRSLTKVIVNELPNFIAATVTTLEMMTNTKAIKESVAIQKVNIDSTKDKLASSIGFYGDIDGMMILIFPRTIAKRACELLLGEVSENTEELLDTLAEFVNIIAGRLKSLLAEKGTSIEITLPRTYEKIDSLVNSISEQKGIQINLTFKGERFTFFLTR